VKRARRTGLLCRRAALLAALLVAGTLEVPAAARFGVAKTLDGKSHAGEVVLTNGAVLVVSTNAPTTAIAVGNLASLKFDARPDSAQPAPPGQGTGLLGLYFDNTNLTGTPFVRLDQAVNFDWGTREPLFGFERDGFSVLWMAEIEAPVGGEFTFHLATDDGGKLWVADQLLIERWPPPERAESSAPITLEAGRRYPLKLAYYDDAGPARARLSWQGPGFPKSVVPKERLYAKSLLPEHRAEISTDRGLLATFYKNADLTGETFSRVTPTVDFDWLNTAPAPGFSATNYSVRWTGQLLADFSEYHAFYLPIGDGTRLWIGHQLLVDHWQPRGPAEVSAMAQFAAGERFDLRLETRHTASHAYARLFWSSPSLPRGIVPRDHLFASAPPRPSATEADAADGAPGGVVLRSGSSIVGAIEQASETVVKLAGLLKGRSLSTVNVARLLLQPLPDKLAEKLQPGRAGVLLANGDFIDGEFKGIEAGQVRLSSVLFGLRNFNARKEVIAVVLRDVVAAPRPAEVRLRDGGVLLVDAIGFAPGIVIAQDAALGRLEIPVMDVMQLKRHPRQ
jgi:hypothetical protein